MTKHRQFYKGMLFAVTAGLAMDFILVHQLIDHHHIYDHPSVNVVEPFLAIVFIIIAIIVFKKEFRK